MSEALERIERAVARIEAAAGRAPATTHPGDDASQLREAHETLRGKVESAIVQLDRLLTTEEAG